MIIWFWIIFILGLRKLEAFFGFLITVMAVSFGYEVRHMYFLHPNLFQHSGQCFTGLILGIKKMFHSMIYSYKIKLC